jgi:hypothetical protein
MLPPPTKSFAILAYADELITNPLLLAAYASAFGPQDDATLVIYAPARNEMAVAEAIETAARKVSVDLTTGPDMVVFGPPDDEDSDNRLVRHCRAVLSDSATRPLRHPRPIYSMSDVAKLRAFADRLHDPQARKPTQEWSYAEAFAYLVHHHAIPKVAVFDGSVPESSLDLIVHTIAEHSPNDRPLHALHVGNFVGMSLGHIFAGLRRKHPESVMVSVDPNIPHRGVDHPQDVVIDLLQQFGLDERHISMCGYSLEKSLSNDGFINPDGYDPTIAYASEKAPQGVLYSLAATGLRFDFAFIDGNHEGAYLRRELRTITDMLRPGAVLALDDVHPNFGEILDAFTEVGQDDSWPYDTLAYDGRVGLLRRG